MTDTPARLLIVDDQPINIQTLYQIFSGDCAVFMATSGEAALEFCRTQPLPDLILLDVVMPGLDGIETCRRLKAMSATADVPVLFVSAHNDAVNEAQALEAGGMDFISKPVTPAVVRARVRNHLTLKAQSDLLRELAFVDVLTGAANRRRLDDALSAEWRRCRRNGTSLAALMIDIDHFKTYNDYLGHLAGDKCLQRVAALLMRGFSRSHDLVGRFGGEEFVCLMPECDISGAAQKARELLTSLAAEEIPHPRSPVSPFVTISIGVAAVVPHGDIDATWLLVHADGALYRAKVNGRNQIAVAETSTV